MLIFQRHRYRRCHDLERNKRIGRFAFVLFASSPSHGPFAERKRARPFVSCVSRQVHRGTVIIVSRQMEGLRVPPTALEAHRAACNSAIASPPNKYPMIDFNWALPILPPPSTSRFSSRSRIFVSQQISRNFSHTSHAKRENFPLSFLPLSPSPRSSIHILEIISAKLVSNRPMMHLDPLASRFPFFPIFIDLVVAKKTRWLQNFPPPLLPLSLFFGRR